MRQVAGDEVPSSGRVSSLIGFLWKWHWRIAGYAAFFAVLVIAGVVLGLRYWLLPNIREYRDYIATSISLASGQRTAIGGIAADWEGLRPHLVLQDVQFYDRQGRPALFLKHVESTLSWWSLLRGEAILHSLTIQHPVLTIRRNATGLIFVAGIPVNESQAPGGFTDWLLSQRRIQVRNAVILWRDDKRAAPPLVFTGVEFLLENRGARHRFGVRATPPGELAAPLDIRGDLRGRSMRDLKAWRGTLYARMDYADLEAWRKWLVYPFELQRGRGALRIWVDFAGKTLTGVTADVRLGDVKTRLAAKLPELDLDALSGRLDWHLLDHGFDLAARKLSLTAKPGVVVRPLDFRLRTKDAVGSRPATGEVDVNGLALEPFVALADYLPLDQEQRRLLAEVSPRGSFRGLSARWTGPWRDPGAYSIKASFAGLGLNPYRKLPGLSGVSGNLDANEKGGVLSLNSHNATFDLPRVFRQALSFNVLTAQANWKVRDKEVEVNLTNVSFANPHLAGNAYGSYRTLRDSPGWIDLTGNLTRADARYVSPYIPLVVNKDARDWLDRALLAGQSNDARVRLKGNLADFPFADGSRGLFQVKARVSGGLLNYAPGWPKIGNITGDLLFQGARMEVNASRASIFGVGLSDVHVEIPDLDTPDSELQVQGKAQGPTGDFLKFLEQSPVGGMIDHIADGAQATGAGKLALKLRIPLQHARATRVAGSYQFVNNRVSPGGGVPPLAQVNGRLDFTESALKGHNVSAQFLGGPLSVSVSAQPATGVRLGLQGRFSAAGLRAWSGNSLLQYLQGTTDWRGSITLKNGQAEMALDSSLQGLSSELPAPFDKLAAAVVPLHFESRVTGPRQDEILVSYGKVAAAKLVRRGANGEMSVTRGTVSFGAAAAEPVQAGIWASGKLPYLNLDRWRALLDRAEAAPGPALALELSGLNLNLDSLDAFGKRFNDLRVNAWKTGEGWRAVLNGRELNGDVVWNREGRGRVVARLKNLIIPGPAPTQAKAPETEGDTQELPALDIVADSLEVGQKKLGKLEVLAVQQGSDWKIEHLGLSAPDYALTMGGLWQAWLFRPRTNVDLKLDVKDIGKFLARLGQPGVVRGGTAKLDGRLSWSGGPAALDFPSLSGNFTLTAANGQFLKMNPGVGRLFSIVSLQALPRRISLDFRDIFSDGFAFDTISGSMRVDHGIMYSDDFKIGGPSARILMTGETDIARETQNLRVKVTPLLGEGVSVAGALLGGPVVGLTAFLVQKVLKDPIDRMASYEYAIGGTWSDPKVSKIQRGTAQ